MRTTSTTPSSAPRARATRRSHGSDDIASPPSVPTRRARRTTAWRFDVDASAPPRPLPDALRDALPSVYDTRTSAKRACRRGFVHVNDSRGTCETLVEAGDVVEVREPTAGSALAARAGARERALGTYDDVAVAYEDAHCAIVVKPDDVVSVGRGSETSRGWSAESALRAVLRPCEGLPAGAGGALGKPRPVHRLDEKTGGLLVCAKTRVAMKELSRAFAERRVKKRYRAILRGRLETREGVVDQPVGGLEATTEYVVVDARERDGRALTLVDFYPKTGRTHQLRRHSKEALGCPILGDARYSFAGEDGSHPDGLFLWATGVIIPADAMPWRGSELVVDSSVGEKFTRAFGVVSSE